MLFASALTTNEQPIDAAQALIDDFASQLQAAQPHFVLLFLSPHFSHAAPEIGRRLKRHLRPQALLGCTAEGVIGPNAEIERRPAISAVAAVLPDTDLFPFALGPDSWGDILDEEDPFEAAIRLPEDPSAVILLADPFSTPMEAVLRSFNTYRPGLPMVGGMASGAGRPGENVLLLDDCHQSSGVVAVGIRGAVDIDFVVSQGCRPIGEAFRVGQAQENVILSLGDRPPLACLEEVIGQLAKDDRALLEQGGLFLGRAVDSEGVDLGRGDFLIRPVIGLDRQSGALAVGDHILPGEIVQFQLRDASTAAEDLAMTLSLQALYEPPAGGLLFSCNGRGTRLYNRPNGDISTVQSALGGVQIGGFFCAGEVGPIGGQNFLHGHTASMALFRPNDRARRLRDEV